VNIHHIGYLVKDLEASLHTFIQLGFTESGKRYYDEDRQADILFIKKNGYSVELIAPWPESKLNGMMKWYKNTGYHLCFKVDNIDAAVSSLCDMQGEGIQSKWRTITPKAPAGAIGDTAVVTFLVHPNMGMIELLQIE